MNQWNALQTSTIEKFKTWLVTEGQGKVQTEIVLQMQLLIWKNLQIDYSFLMKVAADKKDLVFFEANVTNPH